MLAQGKELGLSEQVATVKSLLRLDIMLREEIKAT